ncbi:MAG: ABC transporter substrate-binding protein [Rhodospirillaceae bacterium]
MSSLPFAPSLGQSFGAALTGVAVILATAAIPVPTVAAEPVVAAQAAETSPAKKLVANFYSALLATMKDGAKLKFSGRAERLAPVISQSFDLPAMTRIATGARWPGLPPEEQQRLIEAFSRFSVANYASNFDSFSGEQLEVLGEAPATGGGVIVETRLVPASGDPVQLNYLLRQSTAGLRILDVYVNGTISELAARRSEFTSVLARDGARGLAELLETRTRALATK